MSLARRPAKEAPDPPQPRLPNARQRQNVPPAVKKAATRCAKKGNSLCQKRQLAGDPAHGIAAYSYRDRILPSLFGQQDGLFAALVRADSGARPEVVAAISRAHPGCDRDRWETDAASPEVAVVTLTVTEAGYRPGPGTATDRLLAGLRRRHRQHAIPLAAVPCDNLADNAQVVPELPRTEADGGDRSVVRWLEDEVTVVDTVVDRITPSTTEADRAEVAALTGFGPTRHRPTSGRRVPGRVGRRALSDRRGRRDGGARSARPAPA